MQKIGVVSDTHSFIDEKLFDFFKDCKTIIHAGDIGNIDVLNKLKSKFEVFAVYGNIDANEIRIAIKETLLVKIENVKILITHIGGYPGKYESKFNNIIKTESPNIVITGHSHILKVLFDKKNNHLYINPGAYGKNGFHNVRTAIRLVIDGSNIKDLEVLEIER
jgi:putative phosphoesterase